MNRRISPALLLTMATSALAGNGISPDSRAQLLAAPDARSTVIVMLREDGTAASRLPHAASSHRAVMEARMAQLERSAAPLLSVVQAWNADADAARRAGRAPRREVSKVHKLWTINGLILEGSSRSLLEITDRPEVERVLVSKPRALPPVQREARSDEDSEYTYGLKAIGIDKVHAELQLTGESILVGHLDTGVDGEHPDLAGKVVDFWDFSGPTMPTTQSAPVDGDGHGTHTAGTIAGGNSSGTAIGVAPAAKLIVGRIFDDGGNATDAGVLAAMNWIADPDGDPATNDAPRLVSNSWGGPRGEPDYEAPFVAAVDTWISLGIFPCFAAGNEGPDATTVGTPGGYPQAFAVGATNKRDGVAYFSSRGPIEWDGVTHIKPELSAPGVNTHSAAPGGGYQAMSGTSMACPHMAGVITLLYQAKPDLTIEEITQVLKDTSLDLGETGPDNSFGWGRVQAYEAIQKVLGDDGGDDPEPDPDPSPDPDPAP